MPANPDEITGNVEGLALLIAKPVPKNRTSAIVIAMGKRMLGGKYLFIGLLYDTVSVWGANKHWHYAMNYLIFCEMET